MRTCLPFVDFAVLVFNAEESLSLETWQQARQQLLEFVCCRSSVVLCEELQSSHPEFPGSVRSRLDEYMMCRYVEHYHQQSQDVVRNVTSALTFHVDRSWEVH